MSDQKNLAFSTYKLSESKKYLFQIFPDRACVLNANDLTIVREIFHNATCVYFDIFEFEDIAVFQFENVEYWFFQSSERVERYANNIVFYHDFADSKLHLKRGDKIIHTFGERVMYKRRTRNAFFCMHIVNENYVLDAYRHEVDDNENMTIIRKKITSIRNEGRFPEMLLDIAGSRIFTLHSRKLRIFNMNSLVCLGDIDNVQTFTENFAIVQANNVETVVDIKNINELLMYQRLGRVLKYRIDGNWLLRVDMNERNVLDIYNVLTRVSYMVPLTDAYGLCANLHYLENTRELLWCDCGIFKKLAVDSV